MKSPKSFGKPKRPRLYLRRVVGNSMAPTLRADQIIIVSGRLQRMRAGMVVVAHRAERDLVKRIKTVDPTKGVYVMGDNLAASTDSRTFGWLDPDEIIGRVIWPRT